MEANKIVSVEEVEGRFPNEWVLLEVVKQHNDPRKKLGRLIAHSPNRDALDEPYERFRAEHPDALTAEWFTGELVPEDVTVVL